MRKSRSSERQQLEKLDEPPPRYLKRSVARGRRADRSGAPVPLRLSVGPARLRREGKSISMNEPQSARE